ncbi:MAG TPA: type IV pilus assembly protein PilM [Candidatus Paceibacterota bacterium]|nr:type IV pilus assembly protein PilM [Candidatus Paceibacterota bacterium]
MAFSDFLKKIGIGSTPDSVVGIDIGSSSIKVVQLKKERGVAKLETYGEVALGPYAGMAVGQSTSLPPEKLVEAIKDLFKEVNINATSASLSVPLRASLLKLIEVPKIEERNLDQMVSLEARKYIPVPITEVALDWMIVPSHEYSETQTSSMPTAEGEARKIPKMEVLIVAIHKSIISAYGEIINKLGLKATPLEIETFSASRANLSNELNAVAILDLGASASRLLIVDYGVAKASHVISKGAQDITLSLQKSLGLSFAEAEEAKRRLGAIGKVEGGDLNAVISPTLEYIFYEAQKILIAYQKKYSRPITKVILTGGGAQLKGIVVLAKKEMEVEVEIGNSFKKIEVPAIMEKALAENGSGFGVAAGLALRGLQ